MVCHPIHAFFWTQKTTLDSTSASSNIGLLHPIKLHVWPSVAYFLIIASQWQLGASIQTLECKRSPFGFDYMGKVSITKSGKQCQSWNSQSPHQHSFTSEKQFPDHSLQDTADHCRNPDDKFGGPWCYTTDSNVEWEFCDIPFCSAYPECYRLAGGSDYHGSVSATVSGKTCEKWNELSVTELRNLTIDPGTLLQDDHNHCRNYDARDAPWCFLAEADNQWEYCDVMPCKPSANCRTSFDGREYSGTISETALSVPCQRWDRQAPHEHPFNVASSFPDATLEDAANHCRNPDNKTGGPWCYTSDPGSPWDYCHVPLCKECKSSESGWEYVGHMSKTRDGNDCESWLSDGEPSHRYTSNTMFPDPDVKSASNFCRNPTGSGRREGPWCYTRASNDEWAYCNIPHCSEPSEPRTPIAKHVVYIGIDGLKPSCLLDAPTGAVNIVERLGKEGVSTLTKATGILRTISIPSWHSALCGLGPEHTGVLDNDWLPPWQGNQVNITPITGSDVSMPCVFQELKSRDDNIRTAYFYSWDNFKILGNKGYPGYIDYEYSSEGEDRWDLQDIEVVENATLYLHDILKAAERSMTFIWLVNVDDNGHSFGWCSKEYLAAIDDADEQVGQLLDVIDDLEMWDDVMVILSGDHGGEGTIHGRMTSDDLHIPMFVRGPGVSRGVEFNHQVSLPDVTPTIFHALGLPPSPWWTGRVMNTLWDNYDRPGDETNTSGATTMGAAILKKNSIILLSLFTIFFCRLILFASNGLK